MLQETKQCFKAVCLAKHRGYPIKVGLMVTYYIDSCVE